MEQMKRKSEQNRRSYSAREKKQEEEEEVKVSDELIYAMRYCLHRICCMCSGIVFKSLTKIGQKKIDEKNV